MRAAAAAGSCGEMWQRRSCAEDTQCAGDAVCTDVLIQSLRRPAGRNNVFFIKANRCLFHNKRCSSFCDVRRGASEGWRWGSLVGGGEVEVALHHTLKASFYWDKNARKGSVLLQRLFKISQPISSCCFFFFFFFSRLYLQEQHEVNPDSERI